MEEAVDHLVAYNDWLEHKVYGPMAAVEQGAMVSDDEVRGWLEARERT